MPLSWLYGAIANARNTLYKNGAFKSFSLGVPTISVGNITVGGTGKTPIVAFLAAMLAEQGEKVCILTRGYGRKNPTKRVLVSDGTSILANPIEAGDEPFELARKLLGKAVVVADADRVASGIWARDKFGISAFLLDDAFQHQKVKRDLNIVAIDASNPFGNGKVLPFGILREPLSNLSRADLIIVTRTNLSPGISEIKSQISIHNPECPIVLSKNRVGSLVDLADFSGIAHYNETQGYKIDTDTKILAFCALGNPENFFTQLRRENYQVVSTIKFPDHHFYEQSDIARIEKTATDNGAEVLFTTEKDAVKICDLEFDLPCFVVENEMTFDDETKLRQMIGAVLEKENR